MDRRSKQLNGALDNLDGPVDSGAEPAGIGEEDTHP
jgi:hypothetical protein